MSLKTLLKTALTLILLGILLYQLDLSTLLGVLSGASLALLLPAVLLQIGLTLISVLRWKSILGSFSMTIPYGSLAQLSFIGNFFNLFLPSAIGGDVFRAFYLSKKKQRGMSTTLTTTILERSGGLLALLLIGLSAALTRGIQVQGVSLSSVFLLILAAYVVANLAIFNPRIHDLVAWLLRRLKRPDVDRKMELVYQGLHTLAKSPKRIAVVILLSTAIQFISVLVVWVAAQALSISAPFSVFLVFIPAINLSIMVPLTINGLGLREGLYLLLFSEIGLDPERAVALSLLNTLVVMCAALPGAYFYSSYKKEEDFEEALEVPNE